MRIADFTRSHIFFSRLASFLAGIFTGWLIMTVIPGARGGMREPPLRSASTDFALIHPLLTSGATERASRALAPLEAKFSTVVGNAVAHGGIDKVGIYFRDLESGRWTGVNESEQFSPASMLKVPTMMAVLNLAEERSPGFLEKRIAYDGSFDDNRGESIKPTYTLTPGREYTVEQLVEAMILHSDNNATRLLHANIDANTLLDVYHDLGMRLPPERNDIDFMSPKSYGLFFRIMYNATYLSRAASDHALKLLTRADFPQGIRSAVPPDLSVAQKFGERTVLDPDTGKTLFQELHDCGIVYYPERPYLLCIMTKGSDADQMTRAIQDISRMAYTEVDATYKK